MCLFLIICLTACGSNSVKLLSWNKDGESQKRAEMSLDTEFVYDVTDILAKKSKTITFAGKEFDTKYASTTKSPYFESDFDIYVQEEENGNKYTFALNRYTDEIVKYELYCGEQNYSVPENTEALTRDECYSIALDELEKISGGMVYELQKEQYRNVYEGMYQFVFVRKVCGIETVDRICVDINAYGELFYLQRTEQHGMSGVTEEVFDIAEPNVAVDKKMRKLYGIEHTETDIIYTNDERMLMKLKNGTVGIEYIISVETYNGDKEHIRLFMKL